jgi:hypothetical protein
MSFREQFSYTTPTSDELLPQPDFLKSAANILRNGFAIYPMIPPEKLPTVRKEFEKVLMTYTTFHDTKKFESMWLPGKGRYSMGGFGALGTPESFHNSISAKFRRDDYDVTFPILGTLSLELDDGHDFIYKRFDRQQIKVVGSSVSSETLHRDEGPCEKGDLKFGGWLNLDSKPQKFNCIPGSHPDPGMDRSSRGFYKPSEEETSFAKKHMTSLIIPPGCRIILFEDILHEIIPLKIT